MASRAFVIAVTAMLLTLSAGTSAETVVEHTEHTYRLAEGAEPPSATIEDAAWLAGRWHGEAFGATFEESWHPPSAGSMVGLFKLIRDDEVQFYEILLLVEEAGTLAVKVKHFSRDFVAWEDKDDNVTFRLVSLEEGAIHFSGLSFYRVDDNRIDGYIVMRTKDGVKEEYLRYERAE